MQKTAIIGRRKEENTLKKVANTSLKRSVNSRQKGGKENSLREGLRKVASSTVKK